MANRTVLASVLEIDGSFRKKLASSPRKRGSIFIHQETMDSRAVTKMSGNDE
jgi:hypothetical protein